MTAQNNFSQKSTGYLRKRRGTLHRRLVALGPEILRGSLIKRYIRCGKPGCKCADGPGHGPKYYLSVSQPGRRPEQNYIPQRYQKPVSQFLENYRKLKKILEEICNINREILRRREPL